MLFILCYFFVSVATGTISLVWVAVHGNLFGKRVRMDVQGKGNERQLKKLWKGSNRAVRGKPFFFHICWLFFEMRLRVILCNV